MKLIGIFDNYGSLVYVPMTELTVLLGANDVGKTRILNGIAKFADEFLSLEPLGEEPTGSMAYFEVTDQEMSDIVNQVREYVLDRELDEERLFIDLLGHDVRDSELLRKHLEEAPDGSLKHLLAAAANSIEKKVDLHDQIEAISRSRFVGAMRVQREGDGLNYKKLWLCHPQAGPEGWPEFAASLGIDPGLWGRFSQALPPPITLPTGWDQVSAQVVASISQVLRALSLANLEPQERVAKLEVTDYDYWTSPESTAFSVSLNPYAFPVCEILNCAINRALADFTARNYNVHITPTPLYDWDTESKIQITVSRGELAMKPSDASQGLQMWLQMALLDASGWMSGLQELIAFGADLVPGELSSEHTDIATDFRSEFMRFVERSSADEAGSPSEILDGALMLPDVLALGGSSIGRHLFLLDEPEIHLHPTLAREASRWLEAWSNTKSGNTVIATHSPAFLSMGKPASYNYVWRSEDGMSGVSPIDPGEIQAMDQLSSELGFDRGELLSSIRLLLFVEGRADQIVLETLYRPELRRLGVEVVPVHGVFKFSGILEAEVLWKYTAAEIAVLVDNDIAKEATDIQHIASKRREAMAQRRNVELQQIASLLETAVRAERDLTVYSIPTFDMFGMLDDSILKERFPLYPGHQTAEQNWHKENETSDPKISRKPFMKREYGVDFDTGTFEEVASEMAAQGLRPHALTAIFAAIGEETDGRLT